MMRFRFSFKTSELGKKPRMILNSGGPLLRNLCVLLSRLFAPIKSWLVPSCPIRAQLHKKIALITTGSLATPLVASLVLLPPASNTEALQDARQFDVMELTLPNTALTPAVEETVVIAEPVWQQIQVKRNDTLGSLFQRAGLREQEAYLLSNSSKRARQLVSQIRPGEEAHFLINAQQELQTLRLVEDKLNYVEFSRTSPGIYTLKEITLSPDVIYAFAEARIENSLFESANQAGIEDRLTMKLAEVFGWDIDFVMDIRSGDSFHVMYEQFFLNGENIGTGDIVAAEFRNQGKAYQAVRYTDSNGENHYYTPDGESMRKAFLRSPIEFARISSHFNLKRKHPILHTIRAHKGTDYAASRGTPVRATGDGRIEFAGNKGGYGRVVIIQHGAAYETVYGHLQGYARGVRSGFRVKQGQVIGYVGSSGLATGPHLHYEFHVNGVERNPVTVKFPKADAISETERPRFLAQTRQPMLQLASYLGRPAIPQLALAD